ncbi:MAG: ribosome maturation factor RimM [Ilumatobacteraceae bacterium]
MPAAGSPDAPGHLVEIGRTGRAHGVRGDIAVMLMTDRAERLAPGARVLVGDTWCTVVSSRDAATRWLVRFEGVDDRNAAERLANRTVLAEPLADRGDGLYVDELIGAEVVDVDGVAHGRCVAVVDNPAHELLELEDGALVPVVFIVGLEGSGDGRRVIIDPPDGLFDLGSPG